MSSWCPKTSKWSVSPNNPAPLGTMYRNGAECWSGIIAYHGVVQVSEVQSREDLNSKPALLRDGFILAHAAEVLREVEWDKIQASG